MATTTGCCPRLSRSCLAHLSGPGSALPFLDAHFTPRHDGEVWAGRSAVLALAGEGYRRTDINRRGLEGTLTYRGFQRLAIRYWRRGAVERWRDLSKRAYVREMQRNAPMISAEQVRFGASGARQALAIPAGIFSTLGTIVNAAEWPTPNDRRLARS